MNPPDLIHAASECRGGAERWHSASSRKNRRTRAFSVLRDWVQNGEDSEHALSANEVRRKASQPTEEDSRAAAHVRLGRHFYGEGHVEAAEGHLREAVRLCPQKWNYRRQSMALDPKLVVQINVTPEYWEAFDALGDATYYPAADMPGMPR